MEYKCIWSVPITVLESIGLS